MSKIDELDKLKERLNPLLLATELRIDGAGSSNQVTINVPGQPSYHNVGPSFGPCIKAAVDLLADLILARAKAEAAEQIASLTREAVEESKSFIQANT